MNRSLYFTIIFFFLLLLQVTILNNINLFGYINPYLYIAFIFFYPIKENRFEILTLAFLLGLCVDIFEDTGGLNAFATTTIAFLRPYIFKRIFQKSTEDAALFKLNQEKFGNIFNYVVILTLIHHLILFSLENFNINHIVKIIYNTILSTIFTLVLFFLGNFIFRKENNNEA